MSLVKDIQGKSGRNLLFIAGIYIATSVVAQAFPSWMGVYGSFVRHNGGNPGTFTVLMNQDYYGLHAEVGIRVNGGSWNTYNMTYVGYVSGNSKYEFIPWWEFPATQTVEFYFHGWDDWGGNIWDVNGGQNYSFSAYHNGRVQWVGNEWNYPANGSITSNDNFWVNIETWPAGAAKEGMVVYTDNRGLTWKSTNLSFNGQTGNNDQWHVKLGKFKAAETIRFAVKIKDWAGNDHWDNNVGFDFYSLVNYNSNDDEDGDGMPNGWEIANGFDPTDPIDADDDKDDDELPNYNEYQAGSDPGNTDSDGDGIEDSIEVFGTLTSATNAQSHSVTTALTIDGAIGTNVLGTWEVLGSSIIATTNRGSVQFSALVATTDVYFLEINGANLPYIDSSSSADINVYVDNVFVKCVTLPATTNSASVHCILPMVTNGAQQVTLFWDNVWKYNRLRIDNVKFKALNGADSNSNGIKDWVENWTLARNGTDLLPPSSAVSPAFIEGRAAFPALTAIAGGITTENGAGRRWYANVPLSETTSTAVSVTHENGAVQEAGSIVWRPTNILLDDGITIREGDELLLTAHTLGATDGNVFIDVQGQGSFTTTVDVPVPLQFIQSGSYTLSGQHIENGITNSGSITVGVVRASFQANPAAWVHRVRTWACSNITGAIKVQADPSIRIVDSGSAGSGRAFNILASKTHPTHAVARLGDKGPIIDSTQIEGFRFHSSGEVSIEIVQTYTGGTQRIETGLIQSPKIPNLTIDMEIYAGGVTFDDGLITRQMSTTNLDVLGQSVVGFLRAPGVSNSVCHKLRIYQDGQFIGER